MLQYQLYTLQKVRTWFLKHVVPHAVLQIHVSVKLMHVYLLQVQANECLDVQGLPVYMKSGVMYGGI